MHIAQDLEPNACAPNSATELDFAQVAKLMEAEALADRFGGVAMVAQDESVLFEQAAGYALRWAKLPITRDTRFQLASIGKLFTVVSIGQLIDQGKVSLEDTLTQWLPDHSSRPSWSKVTVRHLLAHTGGFGSYFGSQFEASRTTLKAVRDYFALFENVPLAFEPGSQFAYSNVGYILLGAIIEQASGQDYFNYVQQHVFDPAGMSDSGFFEADEDIPNLAVGYTFRSLPEGACNHLPARTHNQLKPFKGSPAGDSVSTAPDMIRFGQALLSGRLMQHSTFDLLRKPINPWPSIPEATVICRHALGFMTIDSEYGEPTGHIGGFAGTSCSVFIDPTSKLIAVLLTSVDNVQSNPVARELTKKWLGSNFNKSAG